MAIQKQQQLPPRENLEKMDQLEEGRGVIRWPVGSETMATDYWPTIATMATMPMCGRGHAAIV